MWQRIRLTAITAPDVGPTHSNHLHHNFPTSLSMSVNYWERTKGNTGARDPHSFCGWFAFLSLEASWGSVGPKGQRQHWDYRPSGRRLVAISISTQNTPEISKHLREEWLPPSKERNNKVIGSNGNGWHMTGAEQKTVHFVAKSYFAKCKLRKREIERPLEEASDTPSLLERRGTRTCQWWVTESSQSENVVKTCACRHMQICASISYSSGAMRSICIRRQYLPVANGCLLVVLDT